jgi:phosphoglycerate dehydrogenase-like enzyme
MRILFLGRTFLASRAELGALLPADEVVDATPDEARAAGLRTEVVVPAMCRVDAGLLDAVRPRLVQQFGVGLEGVDLEAAAARGIPVANVPADETGNASAVAEVALLHLLVLFRRYAGAVAALQERRLGEPIGEALTGKTAVVIGLGAVGREVAVRLQAMGMRVIGVGHRPLSASASLPAGVDEHLPVAELLRALARADCAVVCASLTPATRGLIGEAALAAMPRGGYLVNVARGPLVDRVALRAALAAGHLAGAGLDVFWDEPIDPEDPILRENVSATPHVGGVTRSAYRATARGVADNVERLRRGEAILNRAV